MFYDHITKYAGPFAKDYIDSLKMIPCKLRHIVFGEGILDQFPSREIIKSRAKHRNDELKTLSLDRPEYREVSAYDEMPVPPADMNTRVSKIDAYHPLLIVGVSLISFDVMRSIF